AVVSTFTIDSILIELERHQHDAEIMKRFLQSLLGHKGLRIYVPTMDDRLKAIAHLALGLDFEDALTLQSAIANNEKEIMSFDKDFDKIKSIKRTQPQLAAER
ncbi:PIN domain-containing protein, partial [Candidatus Woesearchaeota archaeon]|nr:PIN domain-containing protein [Candidatus Woesearchaeota archaeon]